MIFNIDMPGSGRITEDSFNYTGRYLFASDDDGNFELALLSSGTLTWNTLPGLVDLCLAGAGQDGASASISGDYISSGPGGDSGRVKSFTDGVQIPAICSVVVGTHGAVESNTSVDKYSSSSGAKRAGGTGAIIPQRYTQVGTVNQPGNDGVWPYDKASDETMIPALKGHKIGASGGAGHANSAKWVYTDAHGGDARGGQTDAGAGADREHLNGYDATGYGNGAGGGYGNGATEALGRGGSGSNGIALIRNHRS